MNNYDNYEKFKLKVERTKSNVPEVRLSLSEAKLVISDVDKKVSDLEKQLQHYKSLANKAQTPEKKEYHVSGGMFKR